MNYLSVSQIAKKWNMSESSIRNYCAKGKIDGAFLIGKTWNIPKNAKKPNRINKKSFKPETLLTIIQTEKENKIAGGIYYKVQINLTLEQTRYIFETKRYQK